MCDEVRYCFRCEAYLPLSDFAHTRDGKQIYLNGKCSHCFQQFGGITPDRPERKRKSTIVVLHTYLEDGLIVKVLPPSSGYFY